MMKEKTGLLRRIVSWMYGCYAWSVFALIVLFFGSMMMSLHRPFLARRIARLGTRLLFRLVGMPLSITGLDKLPATPHVLLINHSSFLDGIVLTALLPAVPGYAFAVRQEFKSQRVLCPLLKSLDTLVLSRPGAKSDRSGVIRMKSALRRGENLVVFPEGRFRREAGIMPFHSGVFAAAANANVAVVVAGLRGVREALPAGTWLPRRAAIHLEIGNALTPDRNDRDAVERLAASARNAMLSLVEEDYFSSLREKY